jgi:type III pantothenate kinase
MLLACNIENTHVFFGLFDGETPVFDFSLAVRPEKSADEYAILINASFALNKAALPDVSGVIVASVVRPVTATILTAIASLTSVRPLLVGPGTKTGLNIKTDIPSQVGADLVANAVAAIALRPSPLIVVDFGTATTLTGINAAGELCGVLIHPGVRSSLDALSAQAAELPGIALDTPRSVLGKNTTDAMISGIIYGHAAMVDGLLGRIEAAWAVESLSIVATGRYADRILPYLTRRQQIVSEPALALLGLRLIYQHNERHKPGVTPDIKATPLL